MNVVKSVIDPESAKGVGGQVAQAFYSFRKYRQVPRAKAPGGFPLDAIQACGICVPARDSGNAGEFVA